MTKQEYALWAQQESPRSRGPVNILKAFLFGGAVCAIGQLLIFFFEGRGAGELAPVFASLCLVVLSAILTGLNIYDNIAKHAGAGTLEPVQQAGPLWRRRDAGAHHRLCQLDGQRGDGV